MLALLVRALAIHVAAHVELAEFVGRGVKNPSGHRLDGLLSPRAEMYDAACAARM
jgi:hypothetical protein